MSDRHSHRTAVQFEGVGKMYKMFSTRGANLVDALGLGRFGGTRSRYREFWALRDIDFTLAAGERLGILGRNGAGKSTLLKLITGNLAPTEGRVVVNGDVQALLEIGGGLHPEFNGHENIRAALVHLGLSERQIEESEADIAEFTELGSFLDQPFKTYSLGMQARLSFAIGTTVKPEILIIDELLGAGDAYFFGKSTARMQKLIEGGAAVILVSHGLDQIVRFCPDAIWLDRGRIVERGPSGEVVKSYEKFIRELENRRLQAKNQKARLNYDAFARETYTDSIVAVVRPGTEPGSTVDVDEIRLRRDDEIEDQVAIGDAQDAASNQTAVIVLSDGSWTSPSREDHTLYRSLERGAGEEDVFGNVAFFLWFYYRSSEYALEIRYRSHGSAPTIALGRGTVMDDPVQLASSDEWTTAIIRLRRVTEAHDEAGPNGSPRPEAAAEPRQVSRWPGEGSLVIESVALENEDEEETAVFTTRRTLRIQAVIRANRTGRFPVILAGLIFRSDGIVATRHVASEVELDVIEGDSLNAELVLEPLLLGTGSYLVSLGLYRTLELNNLEPSEIYDYLDRSFEFQVVGNPALHNELIHHPGGWVIHEGGVRRALPGTLDDSATVGLVD